jgi:prepilin-type N-terminal cleavage/methylation domain-containing protein
MSTRPTGSVHLKRPSRARSHGGFTLLEVLIALVIGGIVVAVFLEVLGAQARLARLQGAREEARQNARSALELISSELRAADPRSISEAQSSSITFRVPRAWGVVCSHTSSRMAVLYPTAAVALRTGDEFLAIPPVSGAAEWQFLEVSDLTTAAAEWSAAHSACASLAHSITPAPGAASPVRMYAPRTGSPPPGLGLPSGTPGLEPGSPVYVFDTVRYQVALSGTLRWIRRNTGPAVLMQPLAGPVPATGGLVFGYFDGAGTPLHSLATQTERNRVRLIEVTIRAQSRATFSGLPQQDSTATTVLLRNAE